MHNYEIRYLTEDGTPAGHFSAECKTEKQARVLAHAFRTQGARRIEVWKDKALVYQRPGSETAN